jgi:SAM-dependent methyltransferase
VSTHDAREIREDAAEASAVRERYARRLNDDWVYSMLRPDALLTVQERERAIAELFVKIGWQDLSSMRLLEVGCGTGAKLAEILRLGVSPEHLQGIELLPSSVVQARRTLPPSVRISLGDAANMATPEVPPASQDVVYQCTVFSSLLDDAYQQKLADAMWRWVKPGGGVLWYDFTMNNPRNPDVRGVPVARIRQLFPEARMRVRRVTLAPPLARIVTRLHPALYSAFNMCPWLRTHVLAWMEKRA